MPGDVDLVLTFYGYLSSLSSPTGSAITRYHWSGWDRVLLNNGLGNFGTKVPTSWTNQFGASARGSASEVVLGDIDKDAAGQATGKQEVKLLDGRQVRPCHT